MKYESFNFSTDEYAGELTSQCHQTIQWLNRHGYINKDQTADLLSRMVVVPIRNTPRFGERLLSRFFGRETPDNSYVFPITLIDDDYEKSPPKQRKPKLEVV